MSFHVETFGNPDADTLLIQMVDDHDLEGMEQEVSAVRELTGKQDFCMKAVRTDRWNIDLSPWPAPAVFGKEDFGESAPETIAYLQNEIISGCRLSGTPPKRIILGGYSLAGLFALWAGCRTDVFSGIAAASPSVWFPGFTDYLRENRMHADAVYLSLGDREERTRNPVMAQVGNAIRTCFQLLKETGTDCTLEWNKGNHFRDSDYRTAKAFAWVMSINYRI